MSRKSLYSMILIAVIVIAAVPFARVGAKGIPSLEPQTSTLSGYFVSTTGNDANPGTQSQPWRTIGKAAKVVVPGSTVYIRGGVYKEKVYFSRSGTQASPIRILAYPGETPVIDGGYTIPASWTALIRVAADWYIFSGLEVRNSLYMGIVFDGAHDTVTNSYVHHNKENGILLIGNYGTAENNRVWRNAIANEYAKASNWSSGLTAGAPGGGITTYSTLRKNTVWENWGEGMSSYSADHVIMEDNVTHDNFATNIYISDTTNAYCHRNFVYNDPSAYTHGYGAQIGIEMGDEHYTPPSANITITDNIVYGNNRNLYRWQGTQGGGMMNVLIANNTFVNSASRTNVQFGQGTNTNVRFINNVVVQDGTLPLITLSNTSGMTFTNNLWSKTPPTAVNGTGTIVSNPQLSKTGTPFDTGWYQPLSTSPMINKAKVLSEVPDDFFSKSRGAYPDLGAVEK